MGQALLEFCNTPRVADGLSPAKWVFSRRQRIQVPAALFNYKRLSNETLANHMLKWLENAGKAKKLGPAKDQKIDLDGPVVIQNLANKEWNLLRTIAEAIGPRRNNVQTETACNYVRKF